MNGLAEAEAEWEARVEATAEHMEHGALHMLATRTLEHRMRVVRAAEVDLRRAGDALRAAIAEMNEARELVEDTCRLMAL